MFQTDRIHALLQSRKPFHPLPGPFDEIRPAASWFFFGSGPRVAEHAAHWAREIADLVTIHGRGNRRLAIDRCDPPGVDTLRMKTRR